MYYPHDIEEICYEKDHIELVLSEIKANFYDYFQKFIETEAGSVPNHESLVMLAQHFGTTVKKNKKDASDAFKRIIAEKIKDFEHDRQRYLEIMDSESLEEYEDQPSLFKNTILKDKCPIIRSTIQNTKAKELDKFRRDFNLSDPSELLQVVCNITEFAHHYVNQVYDRDSYESIQNLEELALSALLEKDYTVFGVIGGGIKSHFLYKLYPEVFPNRSREAIWALWYLTNKKPFGCKEDSEFLMIDTKQSITQQNYFYPYDLFGYYAFHVYLLLKKEAEKLQVHIDKSYRYVIVNAFLKFIADCHAEEINFLKSQVKEDSYGY